MQKKKRSQWRKLDNAAQAFPAATGKKDTRVFRLYCELKEDVIEEVLQKAVECTLEKYPLYCSVLRKGLFWFYMEQRNLKPKVKAEDRPPCSGLYVPDQKSFLFEVSYYKKKINLEVFHCLTDTPYDFAFLYTSFAERTTSKTDISSCSSLSPFSWNAGLLFLTLP